MSQWKNGTTGDWSDPTAWDTGLAPGPTDDVVIAAAGFYTVNITAPAAANSLTVNDYGAYVDITDTTLAVTGDASVLNGASGLTIDDDGFSSEGGSLVAIGGTFTNDGTIVVGPGGGTLTATSVLSVGNMAGTGYLWLYGSTGSAQAEIDVLSAAPGTLTQSLHAYDDSLLRYASGSISIIASTTTIYLSTAQARIADASDTTTNSALTGLTENDGSLLLANGASASLTGDLVNTGYVGIDNDSYTNEGGSGLTVAGTYTNNGTTAIGPSGGTLGANTVMSVGALAGTGTFYLYGGTGAQAELDIASAAPGSLTQSIYLSNDALVRYASLSIGTIGLYKTLSLSGPDARFANASDTTTSSALTGLTENDGSFVLDNGATAAMAGDLLNTGYVGLDSDGYSAEGGSSLTIAGTYTNSGTTIIGPGTGTLSADTVMTVGALAGTGSLYLYGTAGSAGPQAELDVLSAAPGTLTQNTYLHNNALLRYASGSISTIASYITLTLDSPNARFANASDTTTSSALAGLAEIDGTLSLINGASVALAGDLLVKGSIGLDNDGYTTEGGSALTISGTLTNSGNIYVGSGAGTLSADTVVSVGNLAGSGTFYIYGSSTGTPQAELDVGSAAPGTLTQNLHVADNGLVSFASGGIATIGSGGGIYLAGTSAFIANASDTTTNSALGGLSENDGTLALTYGATLTLAANLLNTGSINLDSDGYTSEGGSSLTISGILTNNGYISIGPYSGGLSATTVLSTNGLAGTGGIWLYGAAGSTAPQAELDVNDAAPAALTQNLRLSGNSLLRYASGSIGTIASNVLLSLNGPNARIADASDTTTNSALTGLAENDGTLTLINGATATLSGALLNTGSLDIDGDGYSNEGGSSLTIAGTLTNSGNLSIGPYTNSLSANTVVSVGALAGTGSVYLYGSTTAQAELDVGSAAPGTLTAKNLQLSGNSLLRYASGSIGTIASNTTLRLSGSAARIADASDTTTNSALTGLTENDGSLLVLYGASVSVSGNLLNTGGISVDGDGYSSEGGSSLTIAGTLTNTGSLAIGPYTNSLSANTVVSVGALAGTGSIYLYGSTTAQAELDVGSAAPGTLTTNNLQLSGNSLLRYASGSIGTIASNTTLRLSGSTARIADASDTTTNSALTGLTENDGSLLILYGASVSVSGNLANTGGISVDGDGYSSEGGSSLTIAGTLTNSGNLYIGPYTNSLSANTVVSIGALTGTGSVYIHGANGTPQAELDVGSAAPGTLTTNNLQLDGNALLLYASGSIGTIAANATVRLSGSAARIANASDTTTSSALTGLTENDGSLIVLYGASVSVSGNLRNTGGLDLDGDGYSSEGGSRVTVAGTLTNTGNVYIGPYTNSLGANTTLTAGGLVNSGTIWLYGNTGSGFASTLLVQGSGSNTGTINVQSGGVLDAAGFSLGGTLASNGTLAIAASAAAAGTPSGGTVILTAGSLTLAGGTIQAGSIVIASGMHLAGTGTVSGTTANAGVIEAQGGTITLSGGASGAGTLLIDAASTLELGGTSTESVTFAAGVTNGTLRLDNPAGFTGTINGFLQGDTIALANTTATGATGTYNSATNTTAVTVSLLGGGSLSYTLAGNYAGGAFTAVQNGAESDVQVGSLPDIAPTLTTPATTLAQQGLATTIPGISVTDPDAGTYNKTLTVSISAQNGTLSATGGGTISGVGTPSLTIAGSLAQIDADLATLSVLESGLGGDTVTISVIDGRGGSAGPQTIAVSTNAQPVLTAPATVTAPPGATTAITGISIADADSAGETLTATLTDSNNPLTVQATQGTVTGQGTTALTLTGTIDQINADLATLAGTPNGAGVDTLTIAVNDGRGGTASKTVSIATNAPTPPTITAVSQVVGNNIESPIDGISVALASGVAATTPMTVTLTESTGGLEVTKPSGATIGGTATAITISGTAAAVNAALASLVYTGGATSIGISATSAGQTATASVPVSLPAANPNSSQPYEVPVSILLQNSSSIIAFGGSTGNPGTAALLQWDDGGTAYVGTVYVNLPLTAGGDATIGFAATNSDVETGYLSASGVQEAFAQVVGDWSVQLGSVGNLATNAFPVSIGLITDSNAGQNDTITLVFHSTLDAQLPDRRVTVIFNQPGGTTIDGGDGGGDDDGGEGGGDDDNGGDGGGGGDDDGGDTDGGDGDGDGGDADGDVHLRTFKGLFFNFQAVGEFVLAKSTVAGDPFQVQVRMGAWQNTSTVSIITEAAVQVGTNRVTFDLYRAATVWVNGVAVALTTGGSLDLTAGILKQLTSASWEILLHTGQTVTVTDVNNFLDVHVALSSSAAAGSVQGLLGTDSAATANLLVLPDGTTLSATPSYTDLYTTFANAWRVTQATSLLDYGTGETTATYTDTSFPADSDPLASLPATVLQQAQALVAAAGITDPNIARAAILDYALTGETSFIASAAATQTATQTVGLPDPAPPAPTSGVGIAAVNASVLQAASGATEADFLIYRTGDISTALSVNYILGTTNTGDLDASYFGGTAPSGTVTFAAGQGTATVAVMMPGGLGTTPSGRVELDISTTASGVNLIASTGFVTINNNQPVPGTHAQPVLLNPSGIGTFTQNGNAYTLDLGTIVSAASLNAFIMVIANQAATGSNTLFGTLTATGSGATFPGGLGPIVAIDAGYTVPISVVLNASTPGALDELFTFNANERNTSGYTNSLGPVTLHITGTVQAAATAQLNSPATLTFGNVHVGAAASQAISITNTGAAGSTALDARPGTRTAGMAAATGTITGLAPGATDSTSIAVGIDTTTAGAKSGTAAITVQADAGNGNLSTLTPLSIAVSGAVYRLATPAVTVGPSLIHTGDSGAVTLTLTNTDPNDGYSENLLASLAGVSGAFTTATAGALGTLTAGASTTITLTTSTAQPGTQTGTVTLTAVSDGTGIDGLGQTTLSTITVPLSLTVNSYAAPVFEQLSGPGTLTGSGTAYTLNLGTLAQGSGLVSINLGILNAATGPADLLAGILAASGSSAFSATGLAAFSNVGAGSADTAPVVTLDTSSTGTFTETITLTPTGSNPSGYSGALPTETLTITGTVTGLPTPVISTASSQVIYKSVSTVLGPISIADSNAGASAMTVEIKVANGTLTAGQSGAGSVRYTASNDIVLTGSLADINAELASLQYTTQLASGTDTATITATDGQLATSTTTEAITIQALAYTAPVLNAPAASVVIPGQQNGIGGLSIVDPYDQATGGTITLVVTSGNTTVPQVFYASGSGGAVVTGQGTSTLTITGTVDQVNAYLSDGITQSIIADAYAKALKDAEAAGEKAEAAADLITLGTSIAGEGLAGALDFLVDKLKDGTANAYGVSIPSANDGPKFVIEADAFNYSFAANILNDIAAIAGGATQLPPPAGGGGGEPHFVTFSGQSFQLEAAGEFLLAASSLPGNSFAVEIRMQPIAASTVASEMTQVGATIGTDRITIDSTRADRVYLNGSAVTLTIGKSLALNAGQITEISAGTYQITWTTGETLTVTDYGDFLNTRVGLGANDTAGTVVGLLGPNNGAANDFTLPDGSTITGPLSSDTLALFALAWSVPQAGSLLDYGPGQTAATFTNTAFGLNPLTLADLPADVVAQAAAVVAQYGITDPVALAAAEYDYIVSGGDTAVISADQALYQGLSATDAGITASGPAPIVLGIIPAAQELNEVADGTTDAVFTVYLTAPATTDTIVTYSVVATQTGDLTAAAFGGTMPTGTVTIAAGQTEAQFTIAVSAGALGSLTSANVRAAITDPGGPTLLTSTASATIVAPAPGVPAVFQLADLTNYGTFIQDSPTSYTLDLGPVHYGDTLPTLQFSITNAAASTPADRMGVAISAETVEGFTISGTTISGTIAAGQTYTGLNATINTIKYGANSEVITFTPTDTNASGYSASMAPVTLTITDTLELPSMMYSTAWGDVHIITFNGLRYDFQAVGEFWLDESRIAGDSFGVQLRLVPYVYAGNTVSVINQAAVLVGTDRVTFDNTRTDFLWVDGQAVTLSAADPTLTLAGGTVTMVSPSVYKVAWTTGEQATITNAGPWINVTDGVPTWDLGGGIAGLQGEGEGQANDFQLPDGTVLPQPLTTDTLYNVFGDAWRVTDATSYFDYAPGQSTATFTDLNYPADAVTLASLPAAVVAQAAAVVAAAGITNPALVEAAEMDYILTGNMAAITSAQNMQQTGLANATATVTVTPSTNDMVGVMANAAAVKATAEGTTPVTFTVYLNQAEDTDATVAYTVFAPDGTYLGASAFGGTLPTGTVTIAAGQTTAQFTIAVPNGALGTLPSAGLEVQIAATTGETLINSTAQTQVNNNAPVSGSPAAAQLVYLGDTGVFTQNGNNYTLTLGSIQDTTVPALKFGILNTATGQADSLAGTFSVPTGTGFTVTGNYLASAIAAGGSYNGLTFTTQTTAIGTSSVTITFHPVDTNGSGYSAALPDITLTVTDPVVTAAQVQLNTPTTIVFPNVRVGTPDSQTVSVTNSASSGAAMLDVTGSPSTSAITSGSIANLAPGATDATSITVGLTTAAAGGISGRVTLASKSDPGDNSTPAPLATAPIIYLFGNVYRAAAPTVTASTLPILHVGDSGTIALTVANTAATDGFSENLNAAITGTTGALSIANASLASEVAPGASDNTLAVTVSTAASGIVTGSATVALTSDGTGIDGLGTLALTPSTVPLSVTVDNYAQAGLAATAGSQTTTGATLNLGTIALGATPISISLSALNTATGLADLLAGGFTVSGGAGFTNALGTVSGLGAGASAAAGTVTLSTATAGTFSETITFNGTGSNASGYSGAVAATSLTITGTIAGTSPVTPTIAFTAPQGGPESGNVSTKAITNTPTPTVSGTALAGAGVSLSAGGTATASGGSYSTQTGTLQQGTTSVTASASNGIGGTATSAPASAFVIPSPIQGVSTPDLASIDFAHLFDQGYTLQFVQGTESANLVDGVLSVGPDTNEAFIQRLYESLLGRNNDAPGMTYWDHQLQTGSDKVSIASQFLSSTEFTTLHPGVATMTDSQFIGFLYNNVLDRTAQTNEIAYWTDGIQKIGRAAVLMEIVEAPEAKSTLSPFTSQVWARDTAGTITHELYETGLGREVELTTPALSFWKADIAKIGIAATAETFALSPEFIADHATQDNAAFVQSLYQNGLGRTPVGNEDQFYLNELSSGTSTRAGVLLQIATSAEATTYLTRNL